jgi:HEAT repeat protein
MTIRRFQKPLTLCLLLAAAWTGVVLIVGCARDRVAQPEEFHSLVKELERVEGLLRGATAATLTALEREWNGLFQQLQTLCQPAAEMLLIPALGDPDPYCRSCAATLLGMAGEKRAVAPLVAMLNDKGTDRYRECRCYAALALGRIGDPAAVPPLLEALGDKDCGLRWQVEEALGHLRDRRAIKPLVKVLLAEKDLGTCYGGAPYLIVAAKKRYEKGDDPPPAWALAQIGAPAVKDVAEAVWQAKWRASDVLVETLGRIGPPAVEALIDLLKRAKPDVRAAAAEALGDTGDKRAIEALTAALTDSDASVRDAAAAALKKLDGALRRKG